MLHHQGRGAAAKIEAGNLLLFLVPGYGVYLTQQGLDVAGGNFTVVENFVIGTETADAAAKGYVDIKPQPRQIEIIDGLIPPPPEYKGLKRAGEYYPQ
jgi:hypothetical protein